MEQWRRWLREIDWTWRDFTWGEWVQLVAAVVSIAIGVGSGIVWVITRDPFWAVLVVIGIINLIAPVLNFIAANRRRLGLDLSGILAPIDEPHPGRPIRIGVLQAILAGGIVAVAALLGLLIWIAS